MYETGNTFEVCDLDSQFHGWTGTVLEVLDEGYYCMVDQFSDDYAIITFDYFEESQMASMVYLPEDDNQERGK